MMQMQIVLCLLSLGGYYFMMKNIKVSYVIFLFQNFFAFLFTEQWYMVINLLACFTLAIYKSHTKKDEEPSAIIPVAQEEELERLQEYGSTYINAVNEYIIEQTKNPKVINYNYWVSIFMGDRHVTLLSTQVNDYVIGQYIPIMTAMTVKSFINGVFEFDIPIDKIQKNGE